LVTAAKGFVCNAKLEVPDCRSIWSSNAGVFEDNENGSRSTLFRLFRGRKRIAKAKILNAYLDRLTLVYIQHEISERAASIDRPLSKGQSRVSVACDDIAKELSISKNSVLSTRRHAAQYLELFLLSGPGDLFALDSTESYS
jgi:hypothetical protein